MEKAHRNLEALRALKAMGFPLVNIRRALLHLTDTSLADLAGSLHEVQKLRRQADQVALKLRALLPERPRRRQKGYVTDPVTGEKFVYKKHTRKEKDHAGKNRD